MSSKRDMVLKELRCTEWPRWTNSGRVRSRSNHTQRLGRECVKRPRSVGTTWCIEFGHEEGHSTRFRFLSGQVRTQRRHASTAMGQLILGRKT